MRVTLRSGCFIIVPITEHWCQDLRKHASAMLLYDDRLGGTGSRSSEDLLHGDAVVIHQLGQARFLVHHVHAWRGAGAFRVGDTAARVDADEETAFGIRLIH